MHDCYLEGFGPCSEKLSAEHFVSHGLLRDLAREKKALSVGGWPGRPAGLYVL